MSKFIKESPVFLVDHRNRELVGITSNVTSTRVFVTYFVGNLEMTREFVKNECGRYIHKASGWEVFSCKRALKNR